MKIKVNKSELLTGTNRTQGAIIDRTQAVINLKSTSKNSLLLSAADRILAVYSEVVCKVEQEGVCFVPAKFFVGIVKELPNGEVTLEVKNGYLHIIAGSLDSFFMKIRRLLQLHISQVAIH